MWDEADEPEALEGQARRQDVLRRTRDLGLRSRKISSALQSTGRLICEVPGCGFDFHAVYGELGRDFAIVHHELPLGSRKRARRTRSSELRIVCANCHAMIHRGGETRKVAAVTVRRD
jgi:5-methylcytosine-specific restriction enzyme A